MRLPEAFRRLKPLDRAVLLAGAAMATMYGGSKGIVTVDDPYIADAGSYVTNDCVHIAIEKRYAFVPDDTEVMVFYREVASTNAGDWAQYVNQSAPGYFVIADFPADLWHNHATNYNWLVAARYVPEPTVHTNGVWQIKGFVVPGVAEGGGGAPRIYAFPNTKTIRKEDQ